MEQEMGLVSIKDNKMLLVKSSDMLVQNQKMEIMNVCFEKLSFL